MDATTRTKIVNDLSRAYETRVPVPRLTGAYPEITIEDSYRIQEEFVARKVAKGARVRGYKVGLTSKAMQEMAGSTEPDFSAMTGDMFYPEALPIPHSNFFSPMIEIEMPFVMKGDERLRRADASD